MRSLINEHNISYVPSVCNIFLIWKEAMSDETQFHQTSWHLDIYNFHKDIRVQPHLRFLRASNLDDAQQSSDRSIHRQDQRAETVMRATSCRDRREIDPRMEVVGRARCAWPGPLLLLRQAVSPIVKAGCMYVSAACTRWESVRWCWGIVGVGPTRLGGARLSGPGFPRSLTRARATLLSFSCCSSLPLFSPSSPTFVFMCPSLIFPLFSLAFSLSLFLSLSLSSLISRGPRSLHIWKVEVQSTKRESPKRVSMLARRELMRKIFYVVCRRNDPLLRTWRARYARVCQE
jgi:hypothetical protein